MRFAARGLPRMPGALDHKQIASDFAAEVNMSADELRQWLRTARSRAVGWKGGEGERRESVGHASGRRLAAILSADPQDLTDEDFRHMRKTVGFIRRHRAQQPANMVTSRWRYSLMNWGHDPLRGAEEADEQ